MMWNSQWQELEAAGHIASTVGAERRQHWLALGSPFLFMQSLILMVLPRFSVNPPISVNLS